MRTLREALHDSNLKDKHHRVLLWLVEAFGSHESTQEDLGKLRLTPTLLHELVHHKYITRSPGVLRAEHRVYRINTHDPRSCTQCGPYGSRYIEWVLPAEPKKTKAKYLKPARERQNEK